MKVIQNSWLVVPLVLAAASAPAHHSFARFDNSKEVTIEGTVSAWQFTNPHCWLYLVSTLDSEAPVTWGIEGNSVSNMIRSGVKKNVFKIGDKVVLIIHPVREAGIKEGSFVKVVSINGMPFTGEGFGGAGPGRGAGPPDASPPTDVK